MSSIAPSAAAARQNRKRRQAVDLLRQFSDRIPMTDQAPPSRRALLLCPAGDPARGHRAALLHRGPTFYADHFALSLATIGTLLLGIRLIDAITDPLFGGFRTVSGRATAAPLLLRHLDAAHGTCRLHAFLAAAGRRRRLPGLLGRNALDRRHMVAFALHRLGCRTGNRLPGRVKLSAWREGATLIGSP